MRILIDTDVLLDLALDRKPYSEDAARIIDSIQQGVTTGIVAWHTVSNLYYILSSFSNRRKALAFVRDLAAIVEVAPTDSATVEVALELEMPDFEDAMQVAAALAGGAERIVTRNTRDFRKAPLAVVRPENLSLSE